MLQKHKTSSTHHSNISTTRHQPQLINHPTKLSSSLNHVQPTMTPQPTHHDTRHMMAAAFTKWAGMTQPTSLNAEDIGACADNW